jgi:aromatic-L-amino-acid/L-tryptophan decarboxylase
MDPDEFRRQADAVIEWASQYLADPERYPVLSRAAPGEIAGSQQTDPPRSGTPFDDILADFREVVLPGITHWNHPGFLAYFGITAAGPGILAEALAATLNVNAMLWRTSPAATELEEVSLGWLRDMLGLPGSFRGHIQDTASTSTLVALASARERLGLEIREEGLAGRGLPPLRLYCSAEAHSSVDKAAITLGIGRHGVRRVLVDEGFRMRVDSLTAAIEEDRAAGYLPFAVVATIGTTSTTSVDPLQPIADLCRRSELWLHVDAAYGGAAAVVPELRHLMAGWEDADSIVVNPHKWLFVPIDCSALFLRDPELTRRAFTVVPEYLATPEAGGVTNLMDYGHALGRRFRALKLWMTLRYFGEAGLAERIREHVRLAAVFRGWVEAEPGWEIMAPGPFSTICFRYAPAAASAADTDRLNVGILERVNASGEVFLSHTRLAGSLTLRVAIGNLRTRERHLARAWELLREAAAGGS